MDRNRVSAFIFLFLALFSGFSLAQSSVAKRINAPVNDSELASLSGGIHPKTARAVDQGSLSPSTPLQRMAIFFKPSAAQQADLDRLLREQQDPSSPNYRKWLTPEQYADRFGMHPDDLAKVTAWLQSHGFTDISVSRSRNSIEFDGNAGQAATAFRTSIHQFVLNGNAHYANTSDPKLPSAFAGTVSGITSLNNFRPHAMVRPHLTSNISGNHFLVPGDVGTIYNINSLYNSGIKGDGESIAVVGQTLLTSNDDHSHADIDTFRSLGGLPAINLQFVKTGSPTYSQGDVDEANLDLEWSGAIAPNATIYFVYSDNALFTSLPYIVTNNLTPVISISYGDCEANFSSTDISTLTTIMQQANTQGQTMVSASGDTGAADCESANATQATHGLAVDVPAATPYVTGMGGSEFTGDMTASFTCTPPNSTNCVAQSDPPYWNGSNSLTDTSATALEYIPEMVWNDTDSSGLAAGGGGVSTLFSKPTWQTGTGVPNDGKRDVPDISLSASPNHDGYIICSQGWCQSNTYRRSSDNTFDVIGGTSAASPIFAGVVALMNQKFGQRLGNVNPNLYSIAASSSSVFHDITNGNNMVPCKQGSTGCPNGGSIGYSAGTGYDLASGWGSVDVGALVSAWNANVTPPDFTLSANPTSLSLTRSATGTSTISVTATGAFSNSVSLSCTVSSSLGATTCSLSPTSVNPGQNATLTVVATNSSRLRPLSLHPWSLEVAFAMVLAVFSLPQRRSREVQPTFACCWQIRDLGRKIALCLLALVLVLGIVSCGGGGSSNSNNNNNNTPLSGSVTVQATSGSLSHSVVIPVTIN